MIDKNKQKKKLLSGSFLFLFLKYSKMIFIRHKKFKYVSQKKINQDFKYLD